MKSRSNLTDEEGERIVNYLFDQMLVDSYLGGTPVAAKEEAGEAQAKSNCATTADCSPSWDWGKSCLLCYAKADFFVAQMSKFEAGFSIGLLDGILGTIRLIYETAEGTIVKTYNYFNRVLIYAGELLKHFIKHQSVLSVFQKAGQDAIDVVKKQWAEVAAIYEVLYPIIQQLDLDVMMLLLKKVVDAVKPWVGELLNGEAGPAYDVGIIAFEVILAVFSGGSSAAVKIGTKVGAKFLPKILSFLRKFNVSGNQQFKELVDHVFSKAIKKKPNGDYENPAAHRKSLLCRLGLGGCFLAGTPVLLAAGAVPIDSVQLFDYAVAHATINQPTDSEAYDPFTSAQQRERDQYELDSINWYEVGFEEVNGSSFYRLALHQDWMKAQGISTVGELHDLNLPEQGILGPSRITSIRHILPQKRPEDVDENDNFGFQPITAIFTHQSNDVWTLHFENGDSLGVTYNHPIYSVTADDWRLAGELEIGEEVLTKNGAVAVTKKISLPGVFPVWNLEVREWHNFLTSEQGIVVHNTGYCLETLMKLFFGKWTRKKVAGTRWVDYVEESGFPSNSTEVNQLEALGEKLKKRMLSLEKTPRVRNTDFPGIDGFIDGGNPISLKNVSSSNTVGKELGKLVKKADNLNRGEVNHHEDWKGMLNNNIDGMMTAGATKRFVKRSWQTKLEDPNFNTSIVENLYVQALDGWMKWNKKTGEWIDF